MRPCRCMIAGALVFVLAACTTTTHGHAPKASSPGVSSAAITTPNSLPTKAVSRYCQKLRTAGERIQQAQVQLYSPGTGKSEAINTLLAELDGLKIGAPQEIKSALSDLASGFQRADSLLAHPSSGNSSALASIGSKLATDARKITGYVASQC